jgi:hypothetical protein
MFSRLRRACFHPPSKLGGIQQAFFINQEKKDLIRIAITRKTSKAYPENTGLLVYFDDYLAFRRYKDKAVMDEFLDKLDVGWTDKFSALYLVGASGNQIWERYRSEKDA